MSDDLAPVVPLYPDRDLADDDRPVAGDERPYRGCLHRRTRLDRTAHRVYCRDCGAEVDPYDVLEDIARDSESLISWRKEAERRKRVAQESLEELLRLERNAKARRRRRER